MSLNSLAVIQQLTGENNLQRILLGKPQVVVQFLLSNNRLFFGVKSEEAEFEVRIVLVRNEVERANRAESQNELVEVQVRDHRRNVGDEQFVQLRVRDVLDSQFLGLSVGPLQSQLRGRAWEKEVVVECSHCQLSVSQRGVGYEGGPFVCALEVSYHLGFQDESEVLEEGFGFLFSPDLGDLAHEDFNWDVFEIIENVAHYNLYPDLIMLIFVI